MKGLKMEIWDAYNSEYEKIEGMTLIRGEEASIPEGVYHLVCHILVEHVDGTFLLMQRDPRKPYPSMWEATAGGSALKGETAEECAYRELREETGCTAEVFEFLGDILTSPGVMTEVIHLFFAKGLKTGRQDLDDDEFLEDGWMDIDELRAGIASGEIQDAKTIIAVNFATLKGLI